MPGPNYKASLQVDSILIYLCLLKRVDGLAVHTKVQSYPRLTRKAQRLCKRISRQADSDIERRSAIKMTTEARDIAVVMLESTLHLFSKQITILKLSSR